MGAHAVIHEPERPKRNANRQRTFRRLQIVYGATKIACTARDWSDTGAQIELPAQTQLPPRFQVIDPSSTLAREARLVWRRGDRAGLAFLNRAVASDGGGPLSRVFQWALGSKKPR
jgi:hypothetical protein